MVTYSRHNLPREVIVPPQAGVGQTALSLADPNAFEVAFNYHVIMGDEPISDVPVVRLGSGCDNEFAIVRSLRGGFEIRQGTKPYCNIMHDPLPHHLTYEP